MNRVAKFQYTFFDALGQNNKVPELPITPFPTLFTPPTYRPAANSVELTVSNFFYENPKTGHGSALEVWLGDIGPLQQRVYPVQAAGPLTNITPFHGHNQGVGEGSMQGPMQQQPDASGSESSMSPVQQPQISGQPFPQRFMPMGPAHTNVCIEMPAVQEIVKVLQAEVKRLGIVPPPPPPQSGEGMERQNGGSDGGEKEGGEAGASSLEETNAALSIAGRSLPLLFIRGADGIGYHSGRTIAVENVFHGMEAAAQQQLGPPPPGSDSNAWMLAAQAAAAAAAAADGGLHGWTLRVL